MSTPEYIAVVETIRTTAALTGSYVAATAFSLQGSHRGFSLLLTIVKSTITSVDFDLQTSHDGGTTWFSTTTEEIAGGTSTVSKYAGTIPVSGLAATDYVTISFDRWAPSLYRFRFKATGAAGANTLAVTVIKDASR